MASNIDITKPVEGNATTQSVRDNFAAAKDEIEALQASSFGEQAKQSSNTGTLIESLVTDNATFAGTWRISQNISGGFTESMAENTLTGSIESNRAANPHVKTWSSGVQITDYTESINFSLSSILQNKTLTIDANSTMPDFKLQLNIPTEVAAAAATIDITNAPLEGIQITNWIKVELNYVTGYIPFFSVPPPP